MVRVASLVVGALLAIAALLFYKGDAAAPAGRGAVTMEDRKRFVALLRPIALKIEREGGFAPDGTPVAAGIPADFGVIQAAHESDWGRSELAAGAAQNIFGMTAEPGTYWRSQGRRFVERETREWTTAGQEYKTRRPFRAYDNWQASYLDWARRIQKPDFAAVYAAAKRRDFTAFTLALGAVGYATDPRYSGKLAGVARAFEAVA